jgi:hypothetical protein
MAARPSQSRFRLPPIRISDLASGFFFTLLPFFLGACDPSASETPPVPVSALYECKGEAGYAGTWEDVIGPLRRDGNLDSLDRVPCQKPTGAPPGISWMVVGDSASVEPESTRVRVVVLDAQCRVKKEYADTVSFPAGKGPKLGYIQWDGRFADGSKAPSGEYFVNTVFAWKSGGQDTAWSKVGMLQSACED